MRHERRRRFVFINTAVKAERRERREIVCIALRGDIKHWSGHYSEICITGDGGTYKENRRLAEALRLLSARGAQDCCGYRCLGSRSVTAIIKRGIILM